MGKPITTGIADVPAARAIREIDRQLVTLRSAVDTLEARTTVVESGVSSVTGSGLITATPTTGDVVLSINLSGYSAVGHSHAESDVTGLVADLAARPTGSGTANKVTKWSATSALTDSSITDNGSTVTVAAAMSVTGNCTLGDASTDTVFFGGSTGYYYVLGDSLNSYYGTNAAATSYINYYGYQSNTTQFRSTVIANGKAATIATFDGSSKQVDFEGAVVVKGNATVCDGSGDTLKFYGGTGATQQTVTGSRGGNAALADLLTKLATLGLIVDGTSA